MLTVIADGVEMIAREMLLGRWVLSLLVYVASSGYFHDYILFLNLFATQIHSCCSLYRVCATSMPALFQFPVHKNYIWHP